MEVKAYVDTCVLSRSFDSRLSKANISAIEKILRRDDIKLVTSPQTLYEFENTQNEQRRAALRLIYKLISKVPYENMMTSTGGIGSSMLGSTMFGSGSLVPDSRITRLSKIFSQSDAVHIFQASKSHCSHFVTIDEDLLTRAQNANTELKILCPGLVFCSLEQLAVS
jgi:predicted nucleic acid-binding protein